MFPTLIKFGPLTIHTYGLLVAAGFLAAFYVARKNFDRLGIQAIHLDRIVLVAMLTGLLGARVFYFALVSPPEFAADPLSFFRIWEGGLVFFGGFIAAAASIFIYARLREISFWLLTDALAAPLVLGQALGRLGCFSAGCCYGKPTTSFLGITFHHPDSLAPLGVALHPAQLYEAAANFLLFWFLLARGRRTPVRGRITSLYLIGYGIFRFLVEFARGDFRGMPVGGLQPSQWIGLGCILMGMGVYVKTRAR